MYDESSFKNYIFWLKVKRVFLMILFAIIGAFIGIVLSQFLIDVLLVLDSNFRVVIIGASTLLLFGISLLLTAGTGKEVQEGYWKMAVLRKLTVISKKLDYLENLDNYTPEQKNVVKKVVKEVKQEIENEPEPEQLRIEESEETVEPVYEKPEIKRDFAGNIVTPTEHIKSPTMKKIQNLQKK